MSITSENDYHAEDYKQKLYQDSLERQRRAYGDSEISRGETVEGMCVSENPDSDKGDKPRNWYRGTLWPKEDDNTA